MLVHSSHSLKHNTANTQCWKTGCRSPPRFCPNMNHSVSLSGGSHGTNPPWAYLNTKSLKVKTYWKLPPAQTSISYWSVNWSDCPSCSFPTQVPGSEPRKVVEDLSNTWTHPCNPDGTLNSCPQLQHGLFPATAVTWGVNQWRETSFGHSALFKKTLKTIQGIQDK